MKRKIEYLLIGHFTKDLLSNGNYQLGGTVYYSGISAKKLGAKVRILTSFSSEIAKEIFQNKLLKGTEIINILSKHSTTFKNIYLGEKRKQFLYSKARKILPKFLPREWQNSSILHLAPVAGEVSEKIAKGFKNSLVGATLQGWLRKREKDKLVSFSFWKNYRSFLSLFNVAILSEEDINFDSKLIKEFAKYIQILVVTQGKKGCTIFNKNKAKILKSQKILSHGNFTGSGDVFATAFLIKFKETKNPWIAGTFANKIAAFHIEKGIENLS